MQTDGKDSPMRAQVFLRIAAVLTLVHAALHTVGGVFGKPLPGPASVAVEAMQSNHFVALGAARTYWEFYRGMGLAVSIFLTIGAVVFWQLASLARNHGRALRPVLATFVVAYVAMAVNSYLYFFAAPVVVELLIALCLGLAFVSAGNVATEGVRPASR
jgi:hypothetical protein